MRTDRRRSFDKISDLLNWDLLPSVPATGGLRVTARLVSRPSDTPSLISRNGHAHELRGWVAMSSTPEQRIEWNRDGLNLVLHTRRTYAIRAPSALLQTFIEETGVEPLVIREGRRDSILMLFRVERFGPDDTHLQSRELAAVQRGGVEPRSGKGSGQGEKLEFLGEGSTVLVHGNATNGSPVICVNAHSFVCMPVVGLKELERLWEYLCRRYGKQEHPEPLYNERDAIGRWIVHNGGRLSTEGFLRHLFDNGWVRGYGGATGDVLIKCPFHRLRPERGEQPATYSDGRVTCPDKRCTHRMPADYELATGFRLL